VQDGQFFDLICLTTAHKQSRIRRFAFASDARNRREACGLRQQTQLFEFTIEMRQTKINPHQDGGRSDVFATYCGRLFREVILGQKEKMVWVRGS
jgi:hypothetical protein